MARLMEKVHRDKVSQMRDSWLEGFEQGIEQGRQQGRMETKYDVARALLRRSMPFDGIVAATGLPLSEVNRLAVEQGEL